MGVKKDIYEYLSDKAIKTWDNAQSCNCNISDCVINHKICALCNNKVIFGAYQEMQPNSRYNWNVDHIIPKSKFNKINTKEISGINSINNLQITHVYCNNIKGEKYNNSYTNGYGWVKNPDFS